MPVRRPTGSRVAAAVLVAAIASGIVLLLGRLGAGDHPGWPLALGLFAVLLGAQLIGPGPDRRAGGGNRTRTPEGTRS